MSVVQRKRIIYLSLIISFTFYSFSIYTWSSRPNHRLNTSLAQQGKFVFQENNCIACHQLYGLGGYIGPDLTNTYSAKGKEYMKVVITYGMGNMPKLNLTELEINALVEFLKSVDSSGISPYKHVTFNYDGTVKQCLK